MENIIPLFKEVSSFLILFVPIIIGWLQWKLNRKDKLNKEALERKDKEHSQEIERLKLINLTNSVNLNVLYNLNKTKLWGRLEIFAHQIFKLFGADRFLILMAVNGKTTPENVSVIFSEETPEVRAEISPEIKYANIKIDEPYKKMLNRIINIGVEIIDVSKMEEGQLKDFYEEEGVKYSIIFFLKRYHLNENDDAIIFCSIAVHKVTKWAKRVITSMTTLTRSTAIPILDKIVK